MSIENLKEENTNNLNELDKKMEEIEKAEIDVQKQIEQKLEAFKTRFLEMSMQMDEKDKKIAALENCLKETSDMLENTLNSKDLPVKGAPSKQKFNCNSCEFQSSSSSGLKTHISMKHTAYTEN